MERVRRRNASDEFAKIEASLSSQFNTLIPLRNVDYNIFYFSGKNLYLIHKRGNKFFLKFIE